MALVLMTACSAAATGSPTPRPSPAPETASVPAPLPVEAPPVGAEQQFKTDFDRHSVPYGEILSGGPPKDGIPALDDPQFVAISEAEAWLDPREPVILVENSGEAKAYPIQVVIWHEIVNDTVGGEPLLVTFCPLCNTAIAFSRTHDGRVLDFGTTGRLRYSNLIMYDRQTETWWQQATGEAIAGEWTGARLENHPATMIAWEDFQRAHPRGLVLSRATGYDRPYGRNPYVGYDDASRPPFLYEGPTTPGQLAAMARVLTLELNGETVAYPYELLSDVGVINDAAGGQPVAVFWQAGTASPLDGPSMTGRDVGSAAAYSATVEGATLTFRWAGGRIVDDESGSEWSLLGRALSGPMKGAQLTPLVSINHFWFSWAAFRPGTRIYQP